MKITDIECYGFYHAMQAMREPLDSHHKSDSYYDGKGKFRIGEEDKRLSLKLIKAGSDHRKHIRLMKVGFRAEIPLYMMKELDTYKIGTDWVTSSTMHKLGSRLLNKDDFQIDELTLEWEQHLCLIQLLVQFVHSTMSLLKRLRHQQIVMSKTIRKK